MARGCERLGAGTNEARSPSFADGPARDTSVVLSLDRGKEMMRGLVTQMATALLADNPASA